MIHLKKLSENGFETIATIDGDIVTGDKKLVASLVKSLGLKTEDDWLKKVQSTYLRAETGSKPMTKYSDSRFNVVRDEEERVDPGDPAAEFDRLMAGESLDVKATDNHAAHIAAHIVQKRGLLNKALRGMAPSGSLVELERHIAEHREASPR